MAEQMTQAEANFYAYISTAKREGREKRDREIVLNMYRNGYPLSEIAFVTLMEEDEVQTIIDNMDAE